MSKIEELFKKHEQEISELRANCPHKKISDWIDRCWAPGHVYDRVKVCNECGEVLERESYYPTSRETSNETHSKGKQRPGTEVPKA